MFPQGEQGVYVDWLVGFAIPIPSGYRKPSVLSRLFKSLVELPPKDPSLPRISFNRYGRASEAQYRQYLGGFRKHLAETGTTFTYDGLMELPQMKVQFVYFTLATPREPMKCILAVIYAYEHIVEIGMSATWTPSEPEFSESDKEAFRSWICRLEARAR